MGFLGRYAKAVQPVLVTLAVAVERIVSAGVVDREALGLVAAGLITSLAVAIVPNSTDGPTEHVPPGGEEIV